MSNFDYLKDPEEITKEVERLVKKQRELMKQIEDKRTNHIKLKLVAEWDRTIREIRELEEKLMFLK